MPAGTTLKALGRIVMSAKPLPKSCHLVTIDEQGAETAIATQTQKLPSADSGRVGIGNNHQ